MAKTKENRSHRTEVVIALIGLVGIVATGMFSNWNKVFAADRTMEVTYSYRPTGNFETELRYYFDVSGTRRSLQNMTNQLTEQMRIALISESPEDAVIIEQMTSIIRSEAVPLDEVIEMILPVYQEHFTLEELQELNRFYSTEIMQEMVAKMPLVQQDLAPAQYEFLTGYQERLQGKLIELMDSTFEADLLPEVDIAGVDDHRILTIAVGDTVEGQFDDSQNNWYVIELPSAGRYSIETLPATGGLILDAVDTVLGVYASPDSSAFVSDDDSGEGVLSRIDHDIGLGRYFIEVRSFSAQVGSYRLIVSAN